eukprot:5095155-Alexandrium_andersonii.AAC.1
MRVSARVSAWELPLRLQAGVASPRAGPVDQALLPEIGGVPPVPLDPPGGYPQSFRLVEPCRALAGPPQARSSQSLRGR